MLLKTIIHTWLVIPCVCRFSQGCTLKSDKREFKIDVEDDDTEQQLSLKAVRIPLFLTVQQSSRLVNAS